MLHLGINDISSSIHPYALFLFCVFVQVDILVVEEGEEEVDMEEEECKEVNFIIVL